MRDTATRHADEWENLRAEHKKDTATNDKYCAQLEGRLKDLNQVVKQRNAEIKQYQSTLEGIEKLQTKARSEIEKVKRERDELRGQRDNLKTTVKPMLEERVAELEALTESQQRDLDSTRQKQKALDKEKSQLIKSL